MARMGSNAAAIAFAAEQEKAQQQQAAEMEARNKAIADATSSGNTSLAEAMTLFPTLSPEEAEKWNVDRMSIPADGGSSFLGRLYDATTKIPGSPTALYEGLKAGIEGDMTWNPYGGDRSVWDYIAGGSQLSQDPHARDIGRTIGTIALGGTALGAMGGEAGLGAAGGADAWTAATDAALQGSGNYYAGSAAAQAAMDAANMAAINEAAGLGGDALFEQAAQKALEESGNYYGKTAAEQAAIDAANIEGASQIGGPLTQIGNAPTTITEPPPGAPPATPPGVNPPTTITEPPGGPSSLWDKISSGLGKWGTNLASGDIGTWLSTLKGAGALYDVFGNKKTGGGTGTGGGGGGGALSNSFGAYNNWTPEQQPRVQPYLNGPRAPTTWQPRAQGYAEGGGVLSQLGGPPPEMMEEEPQGEAFVSEGAGGGQGDEVEARLSPGEYVFDADVVSALGDGSNDEGARRLDEMRQLIRQHNRSASPDEIPPKALPPMGYLQQAMKRG